MRMTLAGGVSTLARADGNESAKIETIASVKARLVRILILLFIVTPDHVAADE